MKTFIATALATLMFITTTNCFANSNSVNDNHRRNRHEVLRPVRATRHCHCRTCMDLFRFGHDAHYAMRAKATHKCNCNTCKDIRHNDRMKAHGHKAPAMHKPVPPMGKPHHNGGHSVPGRR